MTVADDLATLRMFRDRLPLIDEAEYVATIKRVEDEIARLEERDRLLTLHERQQRERAEAAEAEAARLRDGLESADRLLRAVPIERLAPVTKRIVGEARAAIALALLAEDGAAQPSSGYEPRPGWPS